MTYRRTGSLLLFLLMVIPLKATADDIENRIYGRVTTYDGEVYTGLIRWDKNEASWVDILNGTKHIRQRDSRDRSVKIFGVEVNWDDDRSSISRESGVRFGHLKRLENIGSNRALLTLQSGQEIEFSGGSTDIGNDVREIIVEDPERGTIHLEWRDVDTIDFMQAPPMEPSRLGTRLYGTLKTRRGDSFTGYVCWDLDEVLTEDIIDGRDENGHDRDVPFANISKMQRESSGSTRITLQNGEEMVLRGSNDVNSENRGILILDPDLGQVEVDWYEFEALSLLPHPRHEVTYNDFSSDGQLQGTVHTYDGEIYTGLIRWDDDEAYAWEILDGEQDGIEFDVEFAKIQSIENRSSRSATVTLRDGRVFELRGSNDVNDDNDGIFILLKNGEQARVRWRDFKRVEFDKP